MLYQAVTSYHFYWIWHGSLFQVPATAQQELLPGYLSESSASESRLQAFIRLVRCLYYTNHRGAFVNEATPTSLFHQLESPGKESAIQHKEWLDTIRSEVWQ